MPGDDPVSHSMPLSAQGPQAVHLLDRLNAVFKHRRLAGTAFVFVVAVMMIQTYSTVPMYETSARLQIEDEKSTNLSNLNENNAGINYQDPTEYRKTQYSILRSRGLGKRVVRRLDLAHSSMFNGAAARPRDPISLLRDARGAAARWVRSLISKPTKTAAPEAPADENTQESGLISAFIGGIDVKPETDTRLVYVIYRHSNPQFAAAAANALVEEFAQQNLEFRVQNTQKLLEWVTTEVEKQGKTLADNEGAMAAYREANNAISLENKQNIVGQQLTSLAETATRVRTARMQSETLYNQIRNADPNVDSTDGLATVGLDSRVVAAKNALATAQTNVAGLESKGFGPEYGPLKTARTDVDNARRTLVAARRSQCSVVGSKTFFSRR